MFTDMIGYTALGQRNESLSLALIEEQRNLIRPILTRHNGREVKTMGDAFLVEFANALDAVRCAYDVQRASREFNISQPSDRRIRLRIGLHLGDIEESKGDIFGDAVNVASRIEPLAEEGGVCLTRQVYESVRGKIELEMQALGPKSLKNVDTPLEVFRIVMPWLGSGEAIMEAPLDGKRIAILPFRNMSPDPNDEYFAEGMTEELISTVSKIGELAVISRTSVMRYRNAMVPVSQIGQELKVGSVIEGSVRKAGNKVRITAQLIDTKSDGHLWSQSYDRELIDVFAIQGEIAEQVAGSLKVRLLEAEKESITKQATTKPEAYTLYLKGRHYWNQRTEDGAKKSLRCFEEAVRLDPHFARAYSGIADSYNILSDYGWMAPAEAGRMAKANAAKALELDDSLAEAHASLGLTLSNYSWDLVSAEREFRRAIELKPNYAPAHHWYAVALFHMRRYEEMRAEEIRALELDPYSRLFNMGRAGDLLTEGKIEEAIRKFDELVEAYPDFAAIRYWRSVAYVLAGEFDKAIDEAKKFVEMEGVSMSSLYSKLQLAWVYAAAGSALEAEKIVAEAVASREKTHASPTNIALVKLTLGQKEEGYGWLEKAYAERDPALLHFNGMPWAKAFRADPRWTAIEAKLGFQSAPD
jgi:TolB-like protein/Flp pilus assembly protein TadD